MGGQLAPRAAAIEHRLGALIAYDGMYSFGDMLHGKVGPEITELVRDGVDTKVNTLAERLMSSSTQVRRREIGRQDLREAAGLLGHSGAAACPRPMGGSPPVAGAAAPLPRYRRQAIPAATVPQRRGRTDGRAVLRSPGSLLPRKITIKVVRPRFAAGAPP